MLLRVRLRTFLPRVWSYSLVALLLILSACALVVQREQPQPLSPNMRVIRLSISSSLSKKIVPLIIILTRILARMARQRR